MIRQPGIYTDLSMAEYLDIEATNSSRLKLLDRSPAHYAEYKPLKKTPALAFGSICHTALLEQTEFDKRYVVLPSYETNKDNLTQSGKLTTSKATKYYRAKLAEFQEQHAGKEIISADDWNRAWSCSEACHRNERVSDLLRAPGETELTIVWREEFKHNDGRQIDLLCKGRIDKLITGNTALELTGGESNYLIVDLKTTADLADFGTSIARYRYDLQLEFYQYGLVDLIETNDETGIEAHIIAVETDAPYCVHAAPLNTARAGLDMARLLYLLCKCEDEDNWPAPYEPGDPWKLPAWFEAKQQAAPLTAGGKALDL